MTNYNFEVGQRVFVISRNYKSVETVNAITPKGFIKVDGELYKPNGYKRTSDSWDTTRIEPATDEAIEEFKKEIFVAIVMKKLKDITNITYEQAEELNKIFNFNI